MATAATITDIVISAASERPGRRKTYRKLGLFFMVEESGVNGRVWTTTVEAMEVEASFKYWGGA